MTAIAINLDCISSAFARSAAAFAVGLRSTTANRVFTRVFLVCHDSS